MLWLIGLAFENTCAVSGKWNEKVGSVQDFIFCFCVWCRSRELGGWMSRRFPCVTPVIESFSSDLLQARSYWTESLLESCQISTMELFRKNSQQPKDVNCFCKKAPFADVQPDSKCTSNFKGAVNVGCSWTARAWNLYLQAGAQGSNWDSIKL